jgi:hypothetical protein
LGLFPERRFHLLLGCLHFVNEDYSWAICSSERLCKFKPILYLVCAKFRCVYTPEYDISMYKSMMWEGCLS